MINGSSNTEVAIIDMVNDGRSNAESDATTIGVYGGSVNIVGGVSSGEGPIKIHTTGRVVVADIELSSPVDIQ